MIDWQTVAVSSLVFAVLYAVKGGWLGKIKLVIFDGRLIFFFCTFAYFTYMEGFGLWPLALTAALAVGVAASMGEEVGAIGDDKGAWGDYMDAVYPVTHAKAGQKVFGRMYGVKKGIQRGIFLMAPLALVLNTAWLLAPGLLYVPIHFVMGCARRWTTGRREWDWAEPVVGLAIGAGIGFYYATRG